MVLFELEFGQDIGVKYADFYEKCFGIVNVFELLGFQFCVFCEKKS